MNWRDHYSNHDAAIYGRFGLRIEDTGGGCMAYTKSLDNGLYLCLTADTEDCGLLHDYAQPCVLQLYCLDHSEPLAEIRGPDVDAVMGCASRGEWKSPTL